MGPELKIIESSPNLAGAEREGGGLALLTYRDEDPKQVLSVPKTLASPLYLSIPISSKSVPEDPALAKEPHVRSLSYSVNKDPQLGAIAKKPTRIATARKYANATKAHARLKDRTRPG